VRARSSWGKISAEDDLLEKIGDWQSKANSESDPFNKYVSMFIAYNIFYNLYEKRKKGWVDPDFTFGDSKRAVGTIELVEPDELFEQIRQNLAYYVRIIPVFKEEYWPKEQDRKGVRGVALAESIKANFSDNNKKETIDLLIKWLYKIRCNLVHGVKSYKDQHQRVLLEQSTSLLDKILTHLLQEYRQKFL